MNRFLALLLPFLLAPAAHAASTPWQEIAPGAQTRLISSDVVDENGEMLIALEVRLQPGLKTYWRVPGETGIPLQLDFAASSGVSDHEMLWPIPMREVTAGFTDHVYYGEVSFPVRLKLTGDTPVIDVSLMMGVCSEICVPVSSDIVLKPQLGKRDTASDLAIKQALANIPIAWADPDQPLGEVAYDAKSNRLVVEGVSDTLDLTSLIASSADTSIVFGTPQKSPKPGLVTIARLGWGDLSDLTGQTISLIFQSTSGPFQVERTLVGIEQLPDSD